MLSPEDFVPGDAAASPTASGTVTWSVTTFTGEPGTDAYLADLAALTGRVLAVDGGLPLAADEAFLRRRHVGSDVVTLAGRSPDGRLVAAGAVRPTSADGGATFTGSVDPDARGRGVGSRLLDWGLAEAGRRAGDTIVETESLTPAVEALFTTRALRRFFAEDIMRFDLATEGPPPAVWPAGTVLLPWSEVTAPRFHTVYDAAFRERPGFPGWSARQWVAEMVEDDDFRPDWSVLATRPGVGDVGFVTAAQGWIVQVGVVPGARGSGLGAALVSEVLTRMRDGGAERVLLDVNVDNPAARLYRRLGFVAQGRRARFRR